MYKRFYWIFVLAVAMYLGFMVVTPIDPRTLAHYHITSIQLQLIGIALLIPVMLIWFAAFYGFIHFEDYAARIHRSPDGRGLKVIANGLLFLGVGLVLGTIVSSVFQFLVAHKYLSQEASTIITTHFGLVFPFLGTLSLLIGSERLLETLKRAKVPTEYDMLLAAALLVVGVLYALFSLQNPSRAMPVGEATSATYYISDPLIITTIVVPYVITWGLGLFAALRLHIYSRNVPGKIYKQVIRTLEAGILAVIMTSIGIEFLSTATTSLNSLGLGWILVLLYVLLVAIAVGYLFIAYGARQLNKIEDVT